MKIRLLCCRASDKCQREKRKTINGDDLVWAMGILGFEEYGEPLKLYLHKYREVSSVILRVLSRNMRGTAQWSVIEMHAHDMRGLLCRGKRLPWRNRLLEERRIELS